jgi:adenylate cyclase
MMLFTAVIAVLPLAVAGQSIIRVARDELKSAANEQLVSTSREVTDEFNAFFEYSLFVPLDLIRNAIGGDKLDSRGKIVVLKQGIEDLPDVVQLQVNIEGVPRPIVVSQEAYIRKLADFFPDPVSVLEVDPDTAKPSTESSQRATGVEYIPETGDWIATASLPITGGIGGRDAMLYARINLERLKRFITANPFARTGSIHVIDGDGTVVYGTGDGEYTHKSVLDMAREMLSSRFAVVAVEPFPLDDGSISLGAIKLTRAFPWAVVVEKSEADAYAPITDMIRSLLQWLGIGLAVAMVGALLFALGISRPILRIGEAAIEIAKGNLDIRVDKVRSHDEIGDLARRFNDMIVQLNERFELQKFVSRGTMKAILGSDDREVSLGGERRSVAILFADIRGYTAFSEKREPEEVVEVLNDYFQHISDIVTENHGDIDKFVGDEIMAVFAGANRSKHAVECSIAIMDVMEEMRTKSHADLRIGIGVNVGDVVVGAMGSSERKDFTVLRDHVNLAARLCGQAGPDETWVSRSVLDQLPGKLSEKARAIEPISVKGKTNKIEVYVYDGPGKRQAATRPVSERA